MQQMLIEYVKIINYSNQTYKAAQKEAPIKLITMFLLLERIRSRNKSAILELLLVRAQRLSTLGMMWEKMVDRKWKSVNSCWKCLPWNTRIANGLFLLYTRISPTKQHTKQTRKSGQDEDLLSAMKSLNNQREIKIIQHILTWAGSTSWASSYSWASSPRWAKDWKFLHGKARNN